MSNEKTPRNYFEDGKFKLRSLRHDMSSVLAVAENMIYLTKKSPQKRADYDDLMKIAIVQLREIRDALKMENYDSAHPGRDFVEVRNEA